MEDLFLNTQLPTLQFISCEDKAMNFYEEVLKSEQDPEVKKELIKAYSQLILKRIELNIIYAKNSSEFQLTQLKANAEIGKLDRQIQLNSNSY